MTVVCLAGCERPRNAARSQSQQSLVRRADRGDALLEAAVNQLRDLPSYAVTQLRLPEVILDSTKSSDGQDVMAVCTATPAIPDGPINYLTVPNRNGRFRTLGVKPGDIVKYYAALDQESLEAGFEELVAIELKVAQVIDERTLLIDGSLNQPVLDPAKLEIWRYVDDRLVEISRQLNRYAVRRLPPVGWQPSPDAQALDQIVVQLNQWLRQTEPEVEWQPDPMLETLDADVAAMEALRPYISPSALAESFFKPYDGRLIQESVWLRDIARWATGNRFDKLARAEALFDWTVRNIQLVDESDGVAERPWQTLLFGRGTAEQRAWVFALLCRQQGLDVVMLGLKPTKTDSGNQDATKPTFWLPALLVDGQLYLFDTRLGLPIPGVDRKGIATLEQAQRDDALLRQLDIEEQPYPVTAEDLRNVVALIVADPFDLARRTRQFESRLSGDDRLVLSSRASELAERLKSGTELADVRVWDYPFQTLAQQLTLGRRARQDAALAFEPFAWRPVLWKARARHFQGRKEVADERGQRDEEELIDDHREAARLYMDKSIRPTDREIATSGSEERRIREAAKLNATYWLGLLLFDEGNYPVAEHWLSRDELAAEGSSWSAGARYNRARTLEAQGKVDEALPLLENDESPQQHGNKLRAKWLRERSADDRPQSSAATWPGFLTTEVQRTGRSNERTALVLMTA